MDSVSASTSCGSGSALYEQRLANFERAVRVVDGDEVTVLGKTDHVLLARTQREVLLGWGKDRALRAELEALHLGGELLQLGSRERTTVGRVHIDDVVVLVVLVFG